MDSKRIKGLAVISIADGEKIGSVDRVYVDLASKRIVGFTVHEGGGLLASRSASIVDASDIRSLGPDALTLADRSVLRGDAKAAREGLVDFDELAKRKVVTEGGTYVGQVARIEFDESTLRLTAIEVSPGFFKSNKLVPLDQIRSIGTDVIVVADEVCAPHAEPAVPADADARS